MRIIACFKFALLLLTGCSRPELKPPHNAEGLEKAPLRVLLPKAEKAHWNARGRIEILSFVGGHINDSDLIHVAKLGDLWELSLIGTSVTDNGLFLLKNNQKLQALSIQYSKQVTDEGLAVLMFLPDILTLDLVHTKITDKSVESLICLKSVSNLFLKGTGISQEGIVRLKTNLPKCHIQTD